MEESFWRKNLLYKYLGDVEPAIKRYYWVAIICGVVLWYGWLPSGWVKNSTVIAFVPTAFVATIHALIAYFRRREERRESEARKNKKRVVSDEDTVISFGERKRRAVEEKYAKLRTHKKEDGDEDETVLDFTQIHK